MDIAMKVIVLSKTFPAYHTRAGDLTHFADKFASGEKIHTIRANVHGHFEDGEKLSVRQWIDKPYASKQVEIGQIVAGIQRVYMDVALMDFWLCVEGNGTDWRLVAKNDGLKTTDFLDWFMLPEPDDEGDDDEHAQCESYTGDIIHFTDFRYGKGTS